MAIVLENIVKGFSGHLIVNKLNLTVKDGESFVLLGSSGSGKSTILRIIAGLLYPDEGKVFLNGNDVTNVAIQKRDIGFVFQNYAIFKHMSVLDNVEFGLKIRKVKKDERRRQALSMLELVGLSGLGERFPNQLSGGQRQRVALARALVYKPKVLLLDEPFGALDVEIRSNLRKTLLDIQRTLNVTMILVTHDQEEAFELADRIGVIERGNLVEVGTPSELYYTPKKEFIAKFVGGGNVVVGREKDKEIRIGSATLPFPKNAKSYEEGAPVRVLFRPEMVKFSKNDLQSNDKTLFNIGIGELKKYSFQGCMTKLLFELESLTGARPVMPTLSYGQRFANIVCTTASSEIQDNLKIGDKFNIFLKSYHVLEPSALKFIYLANDLKRKEGALTVGRELALSSHGTLNLFHVCEKENEQEDSLLNLKKLKDSISDTNNNYHFDVKVKTGKVLSSFIREVQEGYYDVSLIDASNVNSKINVQKLRNMIKNILILAGVPVLIGNSMNKNINKVLICTRCGEPGKVVLNFGARLSRHLTSKVTLFNVLDNKINKENLNKLKAISSLEQGKTLFNIYNIKSDIKVTQGNFETETLNEVFTNDYNLTILGAPIDQEKEVMELIKKIILTTKSSVLIVPSSAS